VHLPAPLANAAEKVEFLSEPRHYPDKSGKIEVVETHFAWVFLTEHHAYKMKKPMQQATMDYRTLESRERGCRNELRLNRRLAPSVYIDVVPLSRGPGGALEFGGRKDAVDWLVKMHRLPAARMLDRAIVDGTLTPGDLDAVIELLAAFYKTARRMALSKAAYLRRLRIATLQNASDLCAPDLALNRARVDPVIDAQLAYISGAHSLGSRGAHLVEGHGDLRLEHVYLGPPPSVIDCLEFDRDLRRLDPAEEIANLAMGCGRLQRTDLAGELLRRYRNAMRDLVRDDQVQFYMSRRAAIGAKIAAWHVRDPIYVDRQPWIARANSYLDDAMRHMNSALREVNKDKSTVIERHRPSLQ
jgi:aminoglycoside phosphotransferase family enzyme